MKKSYLFFALMIASCIVLIVDLAYLVYAIVQFDIVSAGQGYLSQGFEGLTIFVMVLNALLALFATIYLFVKLILKKNI